MFPPKNYQKIKFRWIDENRKKVQVLSDKNIGENITFTESSKNSENGGIWEGDENEPLTLA